MDQFQSEAMQSKDPLTYYIINKNSRSIVQTNNKSLKINAGLCFKQVFAKDQICKNKDELCICEQMNTRENFEYLLKTEKKYVEVKATSMSEDLILVITTDVTKKEPLWKEQEINNRRLQRAEKLADFGYWEFNVDDKRVIASEGASRIYGVSETVLSLDEVKKFPLNNYRKELDESLHDLITGKIPYDVKFKIKRKNDGEVRDIHSIAEYRKDKRMVFGVLRDITEKEKAQKALLESENNLQLLFQNMNSAFAYHKIITDEAGSPVDYTFLDVNNKFEELTGLRGRDIVGKNVRVVIPGIENKWIERYGNVALTGNPIKFFDYFSEISRYFEIAAYSPKHGFFAVTFTDITDRIKSEKALEESLRDLKMAQRIAKIGNWQFDPQKGIHEWSEEVYKIFERDPNLGPLQTEEYNKVFNNDNFHRFFESFSIAIEKGIPFVYQLKAVLTQNRTKWIEIICQPDPVKGSNGHCLHGTIQDIDESKQIEVELDNSNKLLRTLIDNIPDAIYMKDRNYRKLLANKQDAKNCGVNEIAGIIGKTDFDLYPREIAEKYFADDRKVFESGKAIINREEILPSEDKSKWVLTSKIPLKNDENEIFGIVGIGRDITELKENESKLRLLQQTIEQSPLSVVITDTSGAIEYVNPEFEKTTGYKRDEVIGKNPRILKSGVQDEAHYKSLWDTICSGKNWYGEFHNKRKDKSLYWESAVITPICNDRNEIQQFVAIKEDITELRQMVKDLEIAKGKAEESNRLKTVFLENMSHEIRTPLNGILGFSSIISSGLCDLEQVEQYGKMIENSGQQLIRIIDDIIDISMLQSNQLKMVYVNFNINELLEELFVEFKSRNAERALQIDFRLTLCSNNELCVVSSDKNRIYQVLKNLLDNAFKFTETGFINFGCSDSTEEEMVLFVEDTGIGIEDEKTDLIFESFRQVEESTSRKYSGSGLGLAIVSGIIEKLGGKISVKSEIEKGTVFLINLPRKNG